MTRRELELRIKAFADEQPIEHTRISKNATDYFQVEMTLKPGTAITERFMVQLEAALGYQLGSLFLLRLPREKIMIRFTLPPPYQSETLDTDRIEESHRYSWGTSAPGPEVAAANTLRFRLSHRCAVTYRLAPRRSSRIDPSRQHSPSRAAHLDLHFYPRFETVASLVSGEMPFEDDAVRE